MGETLSLTERLESLKAGVIAGGMAAFAEGLFQVGQGQWLANVGLLGSAAPHFDGLFAGYLAIAGLSGFLFGVTCRYAIREDHNPHLSSGVVLAFGLVRGLAQVNLEDVTPQMGPLILFAVFESIGVFAIAYLGLSTAMRWGWVKFCR
jgi:hypothetical protein